MLKLFCYFSVIKFSRSINDIRLANYLKKKQLNLKMTSIHKMYLQQNSRTFKRCMHDRQQL